MSRRWITVGAAGVVFLVAAVARVAGDEEPPDAPPMSLAECQTAIAAQPYPRAERVTCDRPWESTAGLESEDAAGAALPTVLSTEGTACGTGVKPVLDTVFPTLSARFSAGPGRTELQSTFQLRGVTDPVHDLDHEGTPVRSAGEASTLDFAMMGTRLRQGATYRWRVRGTPPSVPAAGWSPWCEFTVGEKTSDDLGLTEGRDYAVTLPAATWRAIAGVLGPVETYASGGRSLHEPIAVAATKKTATAVTLTGQGWSSVVNGLAYHASWELADLVSARLDGPPRPTMGFPRP